MVAGRIVPIAGTWVIDPVHSSVGLAIRHLFTRMRGRFTRFSGSISVAEDPLASSVAVSIEAASVDFGHPAVGESLRSRNYLDVAEHPTIEFESSGLAPAEGGGWTLSGDLTVKGVTLPVELATAFLGAATSPLGPMRKMSLEAETRITRHDFGMGGLLESPDTAGTYLMGNAIDVTLDLEADLGA